MKKKLRIFWILAGVVTLLIMIQFSAMAANKVVVIPLLNSGGGGDEIPTVTSATGQVWMDRNLGALRVAGSSSDSIAYGWLYQWGRLADGHESRSSPNTTVNDYATGDVPGHGNFILVNTDPWDWRVPQEDNLWQGASGTNNPCPAGFRLPTSAEWNTEKNSWGNPWGAAEAFASPLKLVMAGTRQSNTGALVAEGINGLYWSSTVVNVRDVIYLSLYSGGSGAGFSNRAIGCSVRCIKD